MASRTGLHRFRLGGCGRRKAADRPTHAAERRRSQPGRLRDTKGRRPWTGDLADVADVGPAFGLKLGYRVHPRVALRLDGEVEILDGADLDAGLTAPELRLWHYSVGADIELAPATTRWSLQVNGGLGATTFDTDDFAAGGSFSETYFTLNGGAKVGYAVHRSVDLFVAGQAYLAFTDEDETATFAALSPEVDPFDTAWSFPIVAGLDIKLH